MTRHKKYVLTAMCITLCAVLPLPLRAFPAAGSTILPMHIPVLLCGLIVGPYFGFLAGLLGPMLSSFTTGMPLVAVLPAMMAELATYGLVCGLLIKIIRTKNRYFNIYASLLPAMVAGRLVGGFVRIFIFVPALGESTRLAFWVSSYFLTSLPGIVIQLILIPAIITALEKSKVI